MGNCALKGVSDTANGFNFIRVMTDSGELLKLKGPKLVGEVLNSFPGYKIFGQGHFSTPLFDHDELLGGKFYYLLPLDDQQKLAKYNEEQQPVVDVRRDQDGPEREPERVSSAALDLVTTLANGSALEVLPPPQKGVWRVKLAISPRQLEEILAEEVNTEALIEQMSMAAAATSAAVTPKRTKNPWGLIWKPILANVLKASNENQEDEVKSVHLYTNSQAQANDLNQTSLVCTCV